MNLVLTASFGDRPFKEFTIESQKRYAEKIGADFRVVEEYDVDSKFNEIKIGRGGNTAYLIKLLVINDALNEYDRVIWLDDTCVVSKDTPNLFQTVPAECFAAHNEGILGWVLADKQTKGLYERNGIKDVITSQNYFNTGVMVVSKYMKFLFEDDMIMTLGKQHHFANAYPEQTYLNYLIAKFRLPFFALPSIFNRMAVNAETILDKRVNYETFEPRETRIAMELTNFSFLNETNTRVGQLNGAYIYHITSMYKPQQRYDLIKKLFEIKS
jgi:lipopolysaccharide biosynthesis glycosyltransferase